MGIVVVAAGVGDLAEGLRLPNLRAVTHELRGAIQPQRIEKLSTRRTVILEQLLDVPQGYACFHGHIEGSEIRIRETLPS
jgi:hypothetical protein